MALQIDDNYPEVLALIATTAYDWMMDRLKMDHQEAAVAAFELAEKVRQVFGGGMIYISKAVSWVLSKRNREIYDQFDGGNYAALGRQFGLTEMQVRNIIKKLRQADLAARQGGLF